MPLIAPSILAADFGYLAQAVSQAQAASADRIHVDVMDGRFVPNISIGLVVLRALRRITELPLDVHLMIVEPEKYLPAFAQAGADILIFHAEATPHAHRALELIKESGTQAGLAVNPGTPLGVYEELLPDIDQALLMTVNPGFGGQRFIERSLERLSRLRALRDKLNPECLIEVDGGIDAQTAPQAVRSGADILVAGSAIFNDQDTVSRNIALLRRNLAAAG